MSDGKNCPTCGIDLCLQCVHFHCSCAEPPPDPQPGLRPEVRAFAEVMEAQLRRNDHKPGWKHDEPDALLKRLREETEELQEVCDEQTSDSGPEILREAADVANFAMMIADVCGGLDVKPEPQPGPVAPTWREVAEAFRFALSPRAVEDRDGESDPWMERAQEMFNRACEPQPPPAPRPAVDVERLRELLIRASDGPFEVVDIGENCHPRWEILGQKQLPTSKPYKPYTHWPVLAHSSWEVDAELIAAVLNALPALLDELEALRAVYEAARALSGCLHAPNRNDPNQIMVARGQGVRFSECAVALCNALRKAGNGNG